MSWLVSFNNCAKKNDLLPSNQKVTKFHALHPPAISIKDYLVRVGKYAACSVECFVLALVYVDRIIQSNPSFVVDSLNIHRLLITSIMLAAKFFDDQYYDNTYYAKVGGVPAQEMNSLEVEFLFMANFTLFVTTETYSQYYYELRNHSTSGTCSCSSKRVPPLVIPPFRIIKQLLPAINQHPPLDCPLEVDAHILPPFDLTYLTAVLPVHSPSGPLTEGKSGLFHTALTQNEDHDGDIELGRDPASFSPADNGSFSIRSFQRESTRPCFD